MAQVREIIIPEKKKKKNEINQTFYQSKDGKIQGLDSPLYPRSWDPILINEKRFSSLYKHAPVTQQTFFLSNDGELQKLEGPLYPLPWNPGTSDDKKFSSLYKHGTVPQKNNQSNVGGSVTLESNLNLKINFITNYYDFVIWEKRGSTRLMSELCSITQVKDDLSNIYMKCLGKNENAMRIYQSKKNNDQWRIVINLKLFKVPAIQNENTAEVPEQIFVSRSFSK